MRTFHKKISSRYGGYIRLIQCVLTVTYHRRTVELNQFQIDESFGVIPIAELPSLGLMFKWLSTQVANGSEIGKYIFRAVLFLFKSTGRVVVVVVVVVVEEEEEEEENS